MVISFPFYTVNTTVLKFKYVPCIFFLNSSFLLPHMVSVDVVFLCLGKYCIDILACFKFACCNKISA